MIFAPLIALIALAAPQAADVQTHSDTRLGLAFDYPKSWKIAKRARDVVTFQIPLEGAPGHGELLVVNANYRDTAEQWQLIQRQSNVQLNREVERQWQQEILGVPMLLTRINYIHRDVPTTTLTGLLYTASPDKLLFRLTAPAGAFDGVMLQFNDLMLSLRTLSGQLPRPEDPSVATLPPPPTPPTPERRIPIGATTVREEEEVRLPPVAVALTVAERPVAVHLPDGWTGTVGEDGTLALRHSDLASPLRVEFAETVAEAPQRALLRRSSATLGEFSRVALREDFDPRANRSGMSIASVWRTGAAAGGDIVTLDAVAAGPDVYGILSYRITDAARVRGERSRLEHLLQHLSIRNAP
jgi:hypothetical protein